MFTIKRFKPVYDTAFRQINIDQTPALRFGVNKFGFLRSDRDLLLAAAAADDEKQVKDIMEMAMQSGVKNPANAGFTDEQLIDSLIPRWVSNPGDFRSYAKSLASKYPYSDSPSVDTENLDPVDVEPPKDDSVKENPTDKK